KPTNVIGSPLFSARVMPSSSESTAAAALLLVAPVSLAILAIRSCLFMRLHADLKVGTTVTGLTGSAGLQVSLCGLFLCKAFDGLLQNLVRGRRQSELAIRLVHDDVRLQALALNGGARRREISRGRDPQAA